MRVATCTLLVASLLVLSGVYADDDLAFELEGIQLQEGADMAGILLPKFAAYKEAFAHSATKCASEVEALAKRYVRDDRARSEALHAVTSARGHLHAIEHAKSDAQVTDLQAKLETTMTTLALEDKYKAASGPDSVRDLLKRLSDRINQQAETDLNALKAAVSNCKLTCNKKESSLKTYVKKVSDWKNSLLSKLQAWTIRYHKYTRVVTQKKHVYRKQVTTVSHLKSVASRRVAVAHKALAGVKKNEMVQLSSEEESDLTALGDVYMGTAEETEGAINAAIENVQVGVNAEESKLRAMGLSLAAAKKKMADAKARVRVLTKTEKVAEKQSANALAREASVETTCQEIPSSVASTRTAIMSWLAQLRTANAHRMKTMQTKLAALKKAAQAAEDKIKKEFATPKGKAAFKLVTSSTHSGVEVTFNAKTGVATPVTTPSDVKGASAKLVWSNSHGSNTLFKVTLTGQVKKVSHHSYTAHHVTHLTKATEHEQNCDFYKAWLARYPSVRTNLRDEYQHALLAVRKEFVKNGDLGQLSRVNAEYKRVYIQRLKELRRAHRMVLHVLGFHVMKQQERCVQKHISATQTVAHVAKKAAVKKAELTESEAREAVFEKKRALLRAEVKALVKNHRSAVAEVRKHREELRKARVLARMLKIKRVTAEEYAKEHTKKQRRVAALVRRLDAKRVAAEARLKELIADHERAKKTLTHLKDGDAKVKRVMQAKIEAVKRQKAVAKAARKEWNKGRVSAAHAAKELRIARRRLAALIASNAARVARDKARKLAARRRAMLRKAKLHADKLKAAHEKAKRELARLNRMRQRVAARVRAIGEKRRFALEKAAARANELARKRAKVLSDCVARRKALEAAREHAKRLAKEREAAWKKARSVRMARARALRRAARAAKARALALKRARAAYLAKLRERVNCSRCSCQCKTNRCAAHAAQTREQDVKKAVAAVHEASEAKAME